MPFLRGRYCYTELFMLNMKIRQQFDFKKIQSKQIVFILLPGYVITQLKMHRYLQVVLL